MICLKFPSVKKGRFFSCYLKLNPDWIRILLVLCLSINYATLSLSSPLQLKETSIKNNNNPQTTIQSPFYPCVLCHGLPESHILIVAIVFLPSFQAHQGQITILMLMSLIQFLLGNYVWSSFCATHYLMNKRDKDSCLYRGYILGRGRANQEM